MSLKSKIISKLKEKAKSLKINLSNVRINGLADKLDAIVDNEDDIDGEIDKLDSILSFKELAILDDAKRNADRRAAEEDDEEGEEEEDPETPLSKSSDKNKGKETGDNEMPAWFKSHVESQNKVIEGLTSQLTAFKNGQTVQSRRQQLEAKLKDAPEKFKTRTLRDFDRMKLDSDDEFTNYLAEVEQDVADEVQASADAGLGGDAPSGGVGGVKLKEDEVSPAMKEMVQQREAAAKAKAGA
ncbi:hypothetical protein [Sphingobacterium suaedae]|uniref:PspA/IM30 family protein n=1 Tax=Sphingobacterium suaedae TaxID=1686402 RepID=A0ABW5KIG4_9SPHI